MRRLAAYLRSLDPRLPRSVWILNGGGLANAIGNGIAYPFIAIYLHEVRGFSLPTTGLVLAVVGGAGLVAGPLIGIVVDQIGGRATLAGALVLMAAASAASPSSASPGTPSWPASGTRGSGRASRRSSPASRPRRAATAPSRSNG